MSGSNATNVESLRVESDTSSGVAGFNALTGAATQLADQLDRTDARFTKASAGVEAFTRKNEAYTAQQQKVVTVTNQVAVGEKLLSDARGKGTDDVDRLTRALAQATLVRDKEIAKLNEMTAALKAGASQAELMVIQHKRLGTTAEETGHQINAGVTREVIVLGHEILQGNFSRIPGSLLVLAERSSALTIAVGALSKLFTTFGGAAILGLTAIAAGFAAVVVHGSTMEAQTRSLNVSIQAMGRSADISATAVSKYVDALRHAGSLTRADATAVGNELIRTPGLSEAQIGLITRATPDLTSALGTSPADAAKDMAKGFNDVEFAVKKFDDALNILTPDERATVEEMIRHNEKAGALEITYTALLGRIQGLHKQGIGPMKEALHELSVAWDDFITRLSNSQFTLRMVQGAANILRDPNTAELTARLAQLQGQKLAAGRGGPASGTFDVPGGVPPTDVEAEITAIQAKLSSRLGIGPGSPADVADAYKRSVEQQQNDLKQTILEAQKLTKTNAVPGGNVEDLQIQQKRYLDALAIQGPLTDKNKESTMALMGAVNLVGLAMANASKDVDMYGKAVELSQKGIGRIGEVKDEIARLKEARDADDPSRITVYNDAIKEQETELEKLQKRYGEHVSVVDSFNAKLNAQIKSQQELGDAWMAGGDAVQQVMAREKAEASLASEKILPNNKEYNRLVKERTAAFLTLQQSTGQSELQHQIRLTEDATAAELRIADAYDGTTLSLTRAQNAEKARALAVKDGKGNLEETIALQKKYAADLDAGTAATKRLAQEQASIQELSGAFVTAFDTIGNAISQAFISGQGAAVNWGNVMKAVIGQVIQQLVKLAIINPVLNSIFGTNNGTLDTAITVLGRSGGGATGSSGGSGISSLFNTGGSLLSAGNTLSGGSLLQSLGITGPNGAFSSVGSSISGVLNSGIGGTSLAESPAYAAALNAEGIGAIGEAPTGALGGLSVGGALGSIGGIGAGFALGSAAGGYLQGALNKTGPGPQIGAGVGALVGAAFGPVGSLVGGLIGGAAGSLIGPRPASAYSSIGVSTSADGGNLLVGAVSSQIDDVTQLLAATNQQIASLNTYLVQNGVQITHAGSGNAFQIGQNTPGGFQDPNKYPTLNDAFSTFNFGSSNTDLNAALVAHGSFSDPTAFQTFVDGFQTFVGTTLPQLTANLDPAVTITTQLNTAIGQINTTYETAIATAQQYGLATDKLTDAQVKATQAATDQAYAQYRTTGQNTATSLTTFVNSLLTSNLSPTAAYQTLSSQFDKLARGAAGGDFNSINGLQPAATSLLTASKGVYGSGAGYVADVSRVISAISSFATMSQDTVTNAVITAVTANQTASLQDSLNTLNDSLQQIKAVLTGNSNQPARLAA